MSFDNNYPKRKDWRKPYRKSKAFDRSCRNHGKCSWCIGNRTHSSVVKEEISINKLKEYKEDK